jgi:hypothetical protein
LNDTIKQFLKKLIDKAKTELPEQDIQSVETETQAIKTQTDESKKISQLEKDINKMFDEIKKLEITLLGTNPTKTEGGITRRLKAVIELLSKPRIKYADEKKLSKEKYELETQIQIIRSALTKKIYAYKKLLYAYESLTNKTTQFEQQSM